MNTFFVIFLLLTIMSSLTITFIAIIQILKNEFNDSKIKWILISMIGIIGPILYLIKGRKLIAKKGSLKIVPKSECEFSIKSHYLDIIRNLNVFLKILFLLSISLIIIGYLVRVLNIPALWESKQVGFFLFLIFITVFLRIDVNKRTNLKIKSVFNQIAFWLVLLIFIFKYLTLIIYPSSDAYKEATNFIKTNKDIEKNFGQITGYTILPKGSFQKISDENGTRGIANFSFIIKGRKKYKEIELVIEKKSENNFWEVIDID